MVGIFPADFYQKYQYLGSVPWQECGELFKALEPLVIYMDSKAKPKWCPRWFLRFLHLFGNDNSIVRVRNRKLHELHQRLTKGIFILDFKTKWQWYDLRISVHGPYYIQDLADMIETNYYRKGRRKELIEELTIHDTNFKYCGESLEELQRKLDAYDDNLDKSI